MPAKRFPLVQSGPSSVIAEKAARLPAEHQARAAVKWGHQVGGLDVLKIFPSRKVLAAVVRREERSAPRSQWTPVVPLKANEGF